MIIKENRKKAIYIIVLLCILLVSSLAWAGLKKRSNNLAMQKYNAEKAKLLKTGPQQTPKTTDDKTLSAILPKDFPMETGAKDVQRYITSTAGSKTSQYSLVYTSQKSFKENQDIFSNFLTAKGYELVSRNEGSDLVFYYGSKGNNDLSVQVQNESGKVVVNAFYLTR